jgi:RES domain-containing protein
MAETVSLAVLENLVHMTKQDFPTGYILLAAVVPEHLRVLRAEDLPVEPGTTNQRQLGDQWIDSCDSAVLEVRSTVVPLEHNYLLNPRHPDFGEIAVEPPVPFVFDARLFGPRVTRGS